MIALLEVVYTANGNRPSAVINYNHRPLDPSNERSCAFFVIRRCPSNQLIFLKLLIEQTTRPKANALSHGVISKR